MFNNNNKLCKKWEIILSVVFFCITEETNLWFEVKSETLTTASRLFVVDGVTVVVVVVVVEQVEENWDPTNACESFCGSLLWNGIRVVRPALSDRLLLSPLPVVWRPHSFLNLQMPQQILERKIEIQKTFFFSFLFGLCVV
jgi:hypothetical protein